MGLYDRDYYRGAGGRGGSGGARLGPEAGWSVTTWLIAVNAAVFVLDGILRRAAGRSPWGSMGLLEGWGYFSTDTAVLGGQVWRFLTFQFLHASIGHLFVNMLAVYLFGPVVEAHFGARRYLAFYLLCGLGGAACYLLLSAAGVLVTDPATPLIGASAGVFGLLVAAAIIAPTMRLYLYFVLPVTVRTLALIAMGVAAYAVLAMGGNAGGEAGHFGGGALGFLLMRNQHWLNAFAPRRRGAKRPAAGRKGRRRVLQKDWSKDLNR